MKVAAFTSFGGPDVIQLTEVDIPLAGTGEVRVRVKAAGVQPVDCSIRAGWSPPGFSVSFPQIVGNEFAGVIDQMGPDVTNFSIGDEVLGFRMLGCYAEYVVVSTEQIVAKPQKMSWEAAGGLTGAGQTAHTALEELRVGKGDTVLINGAAGGVGTVALQIALDKGATVIATAREVNHDYLRSLGAIPLTYEEGLIERIREISPTGLDAALDTAGGLGLQAAVELVKDKDRVGTIFAFELYKQLGIRWITSKRSAARLNELVDLYSQEKLRIHIRNTFSLDQAANAHKEMEIGHGRGKIVLTMD
ncbi:NADP-dependent oxidoreductase [Paenibacillus sp. SC116]|uniref:NADP-dependent oxidoreductase n=1 Tax=Paenibacillus sp. SC116 TaxID=2968986 RepID=UPI00215A6385|nr:NADP-dependent oxidoreductase [Paenibacillus sp. SC116]MCR8842635.1 NADP-dependent oxidoreductase [Paenibacillus sp. SC116]